MYITSREESPVPIGPQIQSGHDGEEKNSDRTEQFITYVLI